jgi:alpha-ketoglutarate-dependent taurine dioxygenase
MNETNTTTNAAAATQAAPKYYAEFVDGTRVELTFQARDYSNRSPRNEREAEKAALIESRHTGRRLTIFGPDGAFAATSGRD